MRPACRLRKVMVASGKSARRDDGADIYNGAGHDVVPAIALQKPVPVVLAKLCGRLPADQSERRDQVVNAIGLLTLSARPETPEQVEVAQDTFEFVEGGRLGVGAGLHLR